MAIEEASKAERELQDIQIIDSLARMGVGQEDLKRLRDLMKRGVSTREEQLRILKKSRFQMLDDIHVKQQFLDRIDYMIYNLKQN